MIDSISESFIVYYARDLAVEAHGTQKDKQGNPYSEHLDAVAENVADLVLEAKLSNIDVLEDHITVAYLHDTVEDTELTLDDLADLGFSPWVCEAVEAVTKTKNEYNPSYIKRVIDGGFMAMRVKLADLYHNTEPSRLSSLPQYTQDRLLAKYVSGIHRIETALGLPLTYTEVEVKEAQTAYNSNPSSYNPRKITASLLRKGDKVKGYGEVESVGTSDTVTTMVTYKSGTRISYGLGVRVELL